MVLSRRVGRRQAACAAANGARALCKEPAISRRLAGWSSAAPHKRMGALCRRKAQRRRRMALGPWVGGCREQPPAMPDEGRRTNDACATNLASTAASAPTTDQSTGGGHTIATGAETSSSRLLICGPRAAVEPARRATSMQTLTGGGLGRGFRSRWLRLGGASITGSVKAPLRLCCLCCSKKSRRPRLGGPRRLSWRLREGKPPPRQEIS